NDDRLHPARHQERSRLLRVAPHGLRRLRAGGHALGIAEVDERFVGEPLHPLAHHGQAANARVEDADRQVCCHSRRAGSAKRIPTPTLPSARRCTSRSPGKSDRCAATYASRAFRNVKNSVYAIQSCRCWRRASTRLVRCTTRESARTACRKSNGSLSCSATSESSRTSAMSESTAAATARSRRS